MSEKKLKFGGMSTSTGISLFGKRYTVEIDEDGYKIKRDWFRSPMNYLPLFDITLLALLAFLQYSNIPEKIERIISSFPPFNLIMGLLSFAAAGWLTVFLIHHIPEILDALRKFKLWHGCEHKVIAAAEARDLGNSWKYSRINDRCGATFMLTIFTVYWVWVYFIGLLGVFTITYIAIRLESRFFHKYNVMGIYLGRKVQEYATTSEPPDLMLYHSELGMKALITKETE